MMVQMLDIEIEHGVQRRHGAGTARGNRNVDGNQTEYIGREGGTATNQARAVPVRLAEKLLIRLLAALCTPHERTTTIGDDRHTGMADRPGRFVGLCRDMLAEGDHAPLLISQELKAFFDSAHAILAAYRPELSGSLRDEQGQLLGDLLGQIASAYAWGCERQGFSGLFSQLSIERMLDMLDLTEQYAELAWPTRRPTTGRICHDNSIADHAVFASAVLH